MVRLAMVVLHFQTGVQDDPKLQKSRLRQRIYRFGQVRSRIESGGFGKKKNEVFRLTHCHKEENTFWSLPGGLETAATVERRSGKVWQPQGSIGWGPVSQKCTYWGVLRRLLP